MLDFFINTNLQTNMEKEGLLSELKAKIGDPKVASKFSNLSERTISEYVDKIHPTLGAEFAPTDDFYTTHLGILETFAGNIRAVASSAVEEYKKQNENNPKLDKTIETKTDDEAMKALLEQITKQNARLEKIESDKANEAKQATHKANISSAKTKLIADGATDSAVLEVALKLVSLNGDESVEDIVSKGMEEYNKQYTALRGDGYSPSSQNVSSPAKVDDKIKAEREKAKQERGKMMV